MKFMLTTDQQAREYGFLGGNHFDLFLKDQMKKTYMDIGEMNI